MNAQLLLDQPHTVWTNLDSITGRVRLVLHSTSSITSITVKLEGESRTRLAPPPDHSGDLERPREEVHKILYKVATVFPSDAGSTANLSSQRHFVLNPGTYEYPFRFKFPFNNSCSTNPGISAGLTLSNLRSDIRQPTRHVKTTLPPTLTAFPGLAEIQYYVKVTVKRKEFYKENPRVIQYFNFLPIEPPRKEQQANAETFARRQHQFQPNADEKGRTNIFNRRRATPESTQPVAAPSPAIKVDVRLPAPAIITCNQDVPLRVIITRHNASQQPLYLQSLHIALTGYTHIQAHDMFRDETTTWVVASYSNMRRRLEAVPGNSTTDPGAIGEQFTIDPGYWKGKTLPNTVAPSFETCNISRRYELDVSIGIGYGDPSSKNITILPLKHKVFVYSGISPPASLLAAMSTFVPGRKPLRPAVSVSAQSGPSQMSSPQNTAGPSTTRPPRPPISPSFVNPPTSQMHAPAGMVGGPQHIHQQTTQQQQLHNAAATPPHGFAPMPHGWGEGIEDPPPSYEDAIAEGLPPVDGPRARYDPPTMPPGTDERNWESDRQRSM